MRIEYKVRAVAITRKGRIPAIAGRAKHVLQLPGGGMKPGETPAQAIKREASEELGYRKVEILRVSAPVLFRRNAKVTELTIVFLVRVSKRTKRAMTRRERRRGLHVVTFARLADMVSALRARIRRYGRSAARRDRALIKALGLKPSTDLPALVEQLSTA